MGNENLLSVEFNSSLGDFISASATLTNATNIFTLASTSFFSIIRRVEERAKELAIWENVIKDRKMVMDEMYAIREAKLEKDNEEVEKKIKELKELQARWDKTETIMAANAAAVADTVNLNIGGQKFTAAKAILTQYDNSYFSDLFSSSNPPKIKERFFVDRDPKYFGALLNYLKGGGIDRNVDVQGLKEEFEFYRIPYPDESAPQPQHNALEKQAYVHRTLTLPIQISPLHKEELIRSHDHTKFPIFEGELLLKWKEVVQEWVPDHHFILLYKATQDGWTTEDFHRTCDINYSSFVVIQSTDGFLFGGYSRLDPLRMLQPSSFLYTLTNPHDIPPTKYPLLNGPGISWKATKNLVKHICLGGKKLNLHDIRLSTNCNLDHLSKICFPLSYADTTGKGDLTFTGSNTFRVKEIEVFITLPVRKTWFYDNIKGYTIMNSQYEKIIHKWLPAKTFMLKHKASKHGMRFSDFRARLTHPLPSVILCQTTKGFIFGAYSHYLPFSSVAKHKSHSSNFLFTLTNPHTIPPTQYFPAAGIDLFSRDFIEIYSMQGVDCCVGGADIVLEMAHFGQNDTVTCLFHFPYSFVDSTGKGNRTFTGTDRAVIRDIEVYSVL